MVHDGPILALPGKSLRKAPPAFVQQEGGELRLPATEAGKTRPAIVVQNDLANRTSPTVTVIPLSSKADRVFPFQVLIPAGEGGLERDSKALCEQIRTLSTQRLHQRLGTLSPERMKEIRTALDRHLWF